MILFIIIYIIVYFIYGIYLTADDKRFYNTLYSRFKGEVFNSFTVYFLSLLTSIAILLLVALIAPLEYTSTYEFKKIKSCKLAPEVYISGNKLYTNDTQYIIEVETSNKQTETLIVSSDYTIKQSNYPKLIIQRNHLIKDSFINKIFPTFAFNEAKLMLEVPNFKLEG